MMNSLFIFAFSLMLLSPPALASFYTVDQSHTNVDFQVTHLVISKVNGTFETFDGDIFFDKDNLKKSYFKGTAAIDSIDTNNKKRDGHLKSDDFFNQEKYPTMTLETTSIKKTTERDTYSVKANLTIRDKTKSISFPLIVKGPIKDGRGRNRMAFEASFSIDRFDYGLTWGAALETGELVVGKDVRITLLVQGIEKP